MNVTESELFEIIGRQQAQIAAMIKQIKAHQARATELQDEIERLKDESRDSMAG